VTKHGIKFGSKCNPSWFNLSDVRIVKGNVDRSKIDNGVSGPNGMDPLSDRMPSKFTIICGMTYLYRDGTDCINIERTISGGEIDKYVSESLLYKQPQIVSTNKY